MCSVSVKILASSCKQQVEFQLLLRSSTAHRYKNTFGKSFKKIRKKVQFVYIYVFLLQAGSSKFGSCVSNNGCILRRWLVNACVNEGWLLPSEVNVLQIPSRSPGYLFKLRNSCVTILFKVSASRILQAPKSFRTAVLMFKTESSNATIIF